MLIILGFITICIIISFLTYLSNTGSGRKAAIADGITALIISLSASLILCCLTWIGSYISYLDASKIYYGTYAQYKGAIDVYEDKAVIDMIRLTDFGHKAYNEAMSDFVKDLRKQVSNHNEIVIGKRVLGNSMFFSWFIVGKDLKLLEISEKREEVKDENSSITPKGGGKDIRRNNNTACYYKYSQPWC